MSAILKNSQSGGYDWIKIEDIMSFFISSSIFIASMSCLATFFSFLLYDIQPDLVLLFSAFCTMLTIYSYNKLTDSEEDAINRPERVEYIKGKERGVKGISIISYIIALLLGLYRSFFTLPVILFPLISGYLYSVKISPNVPRLKDITGVKSITVALAWAVLVALLPVVNLQIIKLQIAMVFYFVFIKLFVNTVLFDVRDIDGDMKSNTKTIPVVIGLLNTKKILLLANSTLLPWLMISLYFGLFTRYLIAIIFAIGYGYYHIFHFCTEESTSKKDLSFDLIIDGEWIPIAAIAIIFGGLPIPL